MDTKKIIYIDCTGTPYPEDDRDEKSSIQFSWGIEGFGFGTTTFFYDKNGDLKCDNETLSKDSIKSLLCAFVDRAIFYRLGKKMIVHNGFVSNSSSSSFVVLGNKLPFRVSMEILKKLSSEEKLYALGKNLYEGDDFFKMEVDMLKVWEENFPKVYFEFIEINKIQKAGEKIHKKDIPMNGCEIYFIEKDYLSIDNLENFIERYGDDDDCA